MAVASQFSRHDNGSLKISTQLNDLNLGSRAIKSHVTLLSRQYHYVLPIAFLTYVILQYYIGSVSNICSTFREPASETADTVFYCAAACFFISGFQQVVKIATFKCEELGCMSRSIFMAALTVNMIAGSSSYLTASAKYGGICEDMLGVESVCGQWAEWLTSVPLIVYMTIAVEDKKSLGWEDFVIIGSCFLCVFCGLLLTLAQESSQTGFGLLLLSIGAVCVTVTFLSYSTEERLQNMVKSSHGKDDNRDLAEGLKMRTLSRLLLFVFPPFGIMYILRLTELIDRDSLLIGYQACGVLAKLLFVSTLTESHLGIFESIDIQIAALKLANKTRRSFLRYVFHEVRVPLNTIAMGITVVRDDCDAQVWTEATKEALVMMDSATNFMSETLNNVLSMDKIEEGTMQLNMRAFNMEEVLQTSISTIKGSADARNISMVISCVPDSEHKTTRARMAAKSIPDSIAESQILSRLLLGDRFRVEHVIINFLSNAVKFSPDGAEIIIQISERNPHSEAREEPRKPPEGPMLRPHKGGLKERDGRAAIWSRSPSFVDKDLAGKTFSEITLKVVDCGAGISKAELSEIFHAYSRVRPEQLQQGRGSGLGLVLAKEIIALHSGSVIVESEEGMGSIFGFCIPFELASTVECVEPLRKYRMRNESDSSTCASSQGSEHCFSLAVPSCEEDPLSPLRQSALHSPSLHSASSGIATPILHPASSGTGTPILHPASSGIATPLLHPASSGTGTPVLYPASSGTGTPILYPASSGTGTPILYPASSGIATQYLSTSERPTSTSISFNSPTYSTTSSVTSFENSKVNSEVGSEDDGLRYRFELERPYSIKTCLIVDDTKSNSKMLAMVLSKRGIKSTIAENGQEAVDVVMEMGHQFDIIFMDHTMPVMTGTDASREIRNYGFTRLIVGITGNALDDDVAAFLLAGADCVIAKPLRTNSLDALISYVSLKGFESNPAIKLTLHRTANNECELIRR